MQNADSEFRGLKRDVGLVSLTFTGIAAVVGSGWLFASLYAAQLAGPAAVISWILGGIISLMIALVFAELGCLLPLPGSVIAYSHVAYGGVASFVGAWLAWIGYVATAPIEVTAILEYSANYLPNLDVGVDGVVVLTTPGLAAAILLLGLFTSINYFGVRWLARSNNAITFWKLAIPIVTPIILIAVAFDPSNFTNYGGFIPLGWSGVFSAVSAGGVFFAFSGFRTIADMAGEARNPRRNIPLALIFTIIVTLAMYLLLQIALLGSLQPKSLEGGWVSLASSTPSGPFAAFAVAAGLTVLAFFLYVDAVISPAGTGLVFTGVTTRLTYQMSRHGYVPAFMERLNEHKVPGWGLLINFFLGALFLLPFRGWQALVGVISSSVVLAMAFAPLCLISLRQQLPKTRRPFRVPVARLFCLVTFCLCTLTVYWTGWETNWKVFLLVLVGIVLLPIGNITNRNRDSELNWLAASWIVPYLVGLLILSCLGSFGGYGILPMGWDQLAVILFACGIFPLATRLRRSNQQARQCARTACEVAFEDDEELALPFDE